MRPLAQGHDLTTVGPKIVSHSSLPLRARKTDLDSFTAARGKTRKLSQCGNYFVLNEKDLPFMVIGNRGRRVSSFVTQKMIGLHGSSGSLSLIAMSSLPLVRSSPLRIREMGSLRRVCRSSVCRSSFTSGSCFNT
jgi:hypothetical protein